MMTSALFAMSAWIVTPPAANVDAGAGVNGLAADGAAAPRRAGRRRVAEHLDGAERRRGPRRWRGAPMSALPVSSERSVCATRAASAFLQIDDEHVAAGAPRRVELLDQRLQPRDAPGIVRAQQHAVRARIGDDRDALLRIGGLPRAPAAAVSRRPAG